MHTQTRSCLLINITAVTLFSLIFEAVLPYNEKDRELRAKEAPKEREE